MHVSNENPNPTPPPEPATPPPADPPKADPPPKAEPPADGGDDLKARLAELEKQNKELAESKAALERAEQERKDAELTEIERANKKAEAAEAKLQEVSASLRRREILDATKRAAAELKVELDHTAVVDLYDAKAFDSIKLNAKNEAEGVKERLAELIKAKPYVVKTPPPAPETPAGNGGADSGKSGSGAQESEITPERRAELKKRFRA